MKLQTSAFSSLILTPAISSPSDLTLMCVLTVHRLTFPTEGWWIHLCRSVVVRPSPWWIVPGRGQTVWPEAEPSANPGADATHKNTQRQTHRQKVWYSSRIDGVTPALQSNCWVLKDWDEPIRCGYRLLCYRVSLWCTSEPLMKCFNPGNSLQK